MLAYRFVDVAGLLNFVHGLSQWIYVQPDADVRDKLIEVLVNTEPHVTLGTMEPLYLRLPDDSAEWPIKPSAEDGAEAVPTLPTGLQALSWTSLSLLLALEPTSSMLNRDDLVFVVQGHRSDLLDMLDAIYELEHSDTVEVLIAPINPDTAGDLQSALVDKSLPGRLPRWATETQPNDDQPVASLIKVSGLQRFYLLDKTATDPHLRLFYRHVFPQAAAVPPNLQLYVEWGYRYLLPPASFIMESWQRDKLGLVLLPAPGNGGPLIVSPSVVFRPVLQVARSLHITDSTGIAQLEPVPAQTEPRILDVQLQLKRRPAAELRENENALRHQIQNNLSRLERLLGRERETKARRLYLYSDIDPHDMDRLRTFVLNNPLVLLNEFGYFCGRFHGGVYHMVLLPFEDGSSVVTPDRFPDPPSQLQVFRREPAWAAPGYELYIPRDQELFPPLAQGLDNREEILRQALGMTAEYSNETTNVMVLLYPDAHGQVINYHISLTAEAGFVPLGSVGQSINTHVLSPETVEAVSIQVFENLAEALKPENISQDVFQLREKVVETYRSSWNSVRFELEELLKRGLEARKIADVVQARVEEVEHIEDQQLYEWESLLHQVILLAERVEFATNKRDADFQQRQSDLLTRLHKHAERNDVKRLQTALEAVSEAVHAPDFSGDHADIATMLESLAAEMRAAQ